LAAIFIPFSPRGRRSGGAGDEGAAQDGETLVILLGGGTERRQQKDIETAMARWKDYRMRQASRKGE
jgi:hypothetical protein